MVRKRRRDKKNIDTVPAVRLKGRTSGMPQRGAQVTLPVAAGAGGKGLHPIGRRVSAESQSEGARRKEATAPVRDDTFKYRGLEF